jgi:Tol biopolymer transport system component
MERSRVWSHVPLRRAGRAALLFACALLLSPALSRAQGLRLNGPLVAGGEVGGSQISPDGAWVVYRADQDQNDVQELYRVPLHGLEAPVKLTPPMAANQDADPWFQIAPNATRVVYMVTQTTGPSHVSQLYSIPSGGGTAVRLNGTLVSGGTVEGYWAISSDSARVVYRAEQSTQLKSEVYSAPLDGSAPAVKLNTPVPFGEVRSGPTLSPDGHWVVYVADANVGGVDEIFGVRSDGSSPAVRLSGTLVAGGDVTQYPDTGYQLSADSQWLVYLADQDVDGKVELYSVPLDGSAAAIRLNATLGAGGSVFSHRITPDSTRVVYAASQSPTGAFELYCVDIDGGTPAFRVSPAAAPGSFTYAFAFSPDSSRVLYNSDHDSLGVPAIFSCRLDGVSAPIQLSGAMVPGGALRQSSLSPDGVHVVYVADQDVLHKPEVYSVPLDGSSPPLRLDPTLPASGGTFACSITPQGDRLVYRRSRDQQAVFDTVPIGGGEIRQVARTTQGGSFTPDGKWMVYGDAQAGVSELFVAPVVRPRTTPR